MVSGRSHRPHAPRTSNTAPGDNYFGEDNCECLCKSCEANYRNGWSKGANSETAPKLSIEDGASGSAYSLRRRRNVSVNSSRNQSETPDVNIRPHVPKRTPKSLSRFRNAESLEKSPSAELNITPTKRKRDIESPTESESQPTKKPRAESPVKVEDDVIAVTETLISVETSATLHEETTQTPPRPSSSARSGSTSSRSSPSEGAVSTDATSVDDETIIVEVKRGKRTRQGGLLRRLTAKASVVLSNRASTNARNGGKVSSELGSDQDLDDSSMTVTSRQGTKRKRKLPPPKTDLDHAPAIRIPGDYVLTPALLGEPQSAWINCRHCEEPFVQKDAYYTRASCPRCERHSKLYGYMWPKTDTEGIYDTEKRVLDHRTVHRFIRPAEEKIVRRRDRSSTASRAVTAEVSEVISEKSEAPKRRGGRRKAT